MKAHVCDRNNALISVSRMLQAGNRVVFDQDGSKVMVVSVSVWQL